MTSSHRATLRIRTIDDLIAVIPRLLGFHPHESLTLVVVDAGLLQVTARLDLAACSPGTLAHHLAPLWERHPSSLFLAVAYSDDPALAWAALRALRHAAPDDLDLHRFHADGRRWYDAPGASGQAYDPTTSAAAAAAAYEGLGVLGGRDEVVASLDGPASPRRVRRALRAIERRGLGHDGLVREALRLVEAADSGGSGEVGWVDAAVLALASHDLAFREAAILSTSRANAAARVALWRGVVQRSLPSCVGFALVVLGLAAWVAGQGALQVACMERANGLATDGAWLDFLARVNEHIIHPDEWEQLRADWYCEHLAPVLASMGDRAG